MLATHVDSNDLVIACTYSSALQSATSAFFPKLPQGRLQHTGGEHPPHHQHRIRTVYPLGHRSGICKDCKHIAIACKITAVLHAYAKYWEKYCMVFTNDAVKKHSPFSRIPFYHCSFVLHFIKCILWIYILINICWIMLTIKAILNLKCQITRTSLSNWITRIRTI